MAARLSALSAAALLPGILLADISYDETSRMTGGALAGMIRMAGAFSRQAREPVRSTVAVKGNRMVHANEHQTQIVDLDSETFTSINHDRKTFSVMTFAEMSQAMQDAMANLKEKNDAEVKVDLKETGNTKVIGGLDTREMVMTFDIQARDPKTGQTGSMQMTNHMWIAASVPGYDEVRDFHLRMAKKLSWTPGAQAMGPGSEFSRGFAAAAKEAAKMQGVPLLQVMSVGSKESAEAMAQAARESERAQRQNETRQKETPQQAEKPTVGSAIGGALGGRLGGLGGFGRKKKPASQEAPQEPKPEAQAPAQPDAAAAPSSPDSASAALMEMTIETGNFSTASVDSSRFSVPSGYKKVESEMLRRQR
jgi:hypothetical protein